MAMNDNYLTGVLATAGAAAVTHLGLVDDQGDELTGGDYARLAVTWTSPSNGLIRPNADLTFDVPGGSTVAGWRGYSASTSGTDYGGEDLDQEAFSNAGTYKLLAAQTAIEHKAGA